VAGIGAHYQGENACVFRVWAPHLKSVNLRIQEPRERTLSMIQDDMGYWQAFVEGVPPGSRYMYVLDGMTHRPDPASHFQPQGIYGPSEVVDHGAFIWTDAGWRPLPLEDLVIYELHVGTFTPEGTFEAIIPRLRELKDLGITAIELMPVAQFSGERNWGYDGVFPFAVQNSYGGPEGLKTLVDATHREGLSILLDVVYNHMGPEGNNLRDFGPYFTAKYHTPWGDAINYDEAYSSGVRDFFIENALFWLREYHFDGLRLDALHRIYDQSAKHIVQELTESIDRYVWQSERLCTIIGESDLDDVRYIKSPKDGGYGLGAQWADDFHHSLHALLTGERTGYYEDFGDIEQLAKALREGFVYTWQYSVHRKRFHGSHSRQRPTRQFIVCAQNHDQVGNRMLGERLSQLVDFESLKLAAGTLLLSPYIPLLFMGEEYAEDSPFLYFVSHTAADLVAAVRKGRRAEFSAFHWDQRSPDPQAEETFEQSRLDWDKRTQAGHRTMLAFYKQLLGLRRIIPQMVSRKNLTVGTVPEQNVLLWQRRHEWGEIHALLNFSRDPETILLPAPRRTWTKVLDSADTQWDGPGASAPQSIRGAEAVTLPPRSIVVYQAGAPVATKEMQAIRTSVVEEDTDARSDRNI
jgi:maltooligosyltrehalose trehalohydrolase